MDINHFLKDVINLNEYIKATRDVLNRRKNFKVTISIDTILTLKNLRSLEIEYLNKCDENGVACIVFEGLLASPPSKTWDVLAKDLIYLLQYWLEAIRKYFANHSTQWWMFLKLMLKFIKEIHLKYPTIPNMLVEYTADCLFDLATAPKPDMFQRHEILHCLNMVCSESGREIRFTMRTKFGDYFVKIAFHMATSGYLPYQYSALECLIRWLVPRQDRFLRAASAEKWLPLDLYPEAAKTIFLNSNWMNFFQEARNFLNILNEGNGLVTSVICRRITIGEIELINGSESLQSWLDFNTTGKLISVLLDPRTLKALGVADHKFCESLLIADEIVESTMLRREPLGLTISLATLAAPCIQPIDISAGSARHVSIVVSSGTDLRTLDGAMRKTFGNKYQLLIDLDADVSQSPQRSYSKKNELTSEDDTRFSHPVVRKRRKAFGYIVKPRNPAGLSSPSSVSTSSLIHLRDKLTALPRCDFDKVPVSVWAKPALSHVSEGTEREDSIITTKFQPNGVCNTSVRPLNHNKTEENKSKSEGETVKPKIRSRGGRPILSPVVSDDNCTSILLVATVGSDRDSVINETVERLSKSKDFQEGNIVDLLLQEALQYKPKKNDVCNTGINTDEKKIQVESESIDDTPKEMQKSKGRMPYKKNCTVVSKSTTDDESNTEAINETPFYVNLRKNTRNKTTVQAQRQIDEDFFSQHVAENVKRDIVISPSLAKKINESSSETSENFDDLLMNEAVHTDVEEIIFKEIAVSDCLNDMVDKVCDENNKLAKCQNITMSTIKEEELDARFQEKMAKPLDEQKPKRNIKPKTKPVRKRATKKTKKLEQESNKKMSTIIEQKEEDNLPKEITPEIVDAVKTLSPEKKSPCAKGTETPFMRRKRKLYSPKDDAINNEIRELTIAQTSDDASRSEIKTRNIIKTTATCYKELEKERQNYIRLPRSRKSKGKVIEMPPPRTIKMDSMFDNLKQTICGNEEIILVDKNTDVYNFSNESGDDDFRKKIQIKKCFSKTVGSTSTAKKSRKTRCVKESNSSDEETNKPVNRKKVTKRANKRGSKAKIPITDLVDTETDLIDEKMRKAGIEELNISIIEHPTNLEPVEIEPAFKEVIRMDEIDDSGSNDTLISKKNFEKTELVFGNEFHTLALKRSTKKKQIVSHPRTTNDSPTQSTAFRRTNKNLEVEQIPNNKPDKPLAPKKNVSSRVKINTEVLSIKKEKGLVKKDKTITISEKNDDETLSPLPGLVVETMRTNKEDNINDNLLTTNMLQKFKKLYQDGLDVGNDTTINTQNMLTDVERIDFSVQNCFEEEIYFVDDNKENPNAGSHKYQEGKKVSPTKTTKNKYKIQPNEEENIDTINIIHLNDSQSEKTIATDDITAHGDFDEAPPNSENINEELQPRELQDMDQSTKDYFTKLTRELRISASKGRESSKSVESEEVTTILRNESEKTRSVISPIVSLKRLSFKDISYWMPSRRTSDTDSPESSPKLSQTNRKDNDESKFKSASAETTSPLIENKTPKTSTSGFIESKISRISLAEFEKWLPMPKNFEEQNVRSPQRNKSNGDLKLVYRTRSKEKNATEALPSVTKQKAVEDIKKSKCIKKQIDIDHIDSNTINTRKLRNRASKRKAESQCAICVSDSDSKDKKVNDSAIKIAKTSEKNTRKKREPVNLIDDFDKPNTFIMKDPTKPKVPTKTLPGSDKTSRRIQIIKPTISPTKLTDDFVSKIEDNSSGDEYLETIRNRFSKTKDTKAEKPKNSIPKSKSIESLIEESPLTIKRKSTTPLLKQPKMQKKADEPSVFEEPKSRFFESKRSSEINKAVEILEDVVLSASGPSLSSVNDWFKRTGHSDHTPMSYKDIILNVMEKVDTTIVETNQNTSKKLVNLVVESQKNMSEQINVQRNMFRNVAREMVVNIVDVIEKTFIDMDQKNQERNRDFIDKFKNQAYELIRDDFKRKRAMVLMLKEDVEAVTKHIESRNDS